MVRNSLATAEMGHDSNLKRYADHTQESITSSIDVCSVESTVEGNSTVTMAAVAILNAQYTVYRESFMKENFCDTSIATVFVRKLSDSVMYYFFLK